jgi:cytochrome c peroxidase
MIMGLLVAAPGCAELESEETEEDLHWVDREQLKELRRIAAGAFLFNHGTFGGNDRTCATCHPSRILREESGTLSPADVEALFQHDPDNALFQHDAADVMGGDTFDRIREHATILIEMPLPPNVRLVGSDARSVILPRGIPTTMNTPALDPVLMYDGRAPDLESQALGAIQGHAQVEGDVPEFALEAIASFQAAVLFNRDNLRRFARKGEPVTIPFGTTESEQRGRRFFIADNTDDPDMVGESPDSKCGWCHSGPMLDGTSAFFSENIAPIPATEGLRFITTLVSEINPLGLPVHDFEFTLPDGSTVVVSSPDPGVALVGGAPGLPFGGLHPNFVGFFKIPTLWGTADTAPYFHDNSSKTIEELMDHYDLALFLLSSNNPRNPPIIDLTEQEKADIAAYLRLL